MHVLHFSFQIIGIHTKEYTYKKGERIIWKRVHYTERTESYRYNIFKGENISSGKVYATYKERSTIHREG